MICCNLPEYELVTVFTVKKSDFFLWMNSLIGDLLQSDRVTVLLEYLDCTLATCGWILLHVVGVCITQWLLATPILLYYCKRFSVMNILFTYWFFSALFIAVCR